MPSDSLSQEHSDLLYLLGYYHLQHGNFSRAVIYFESILTFYPSDSKVLHALAYAHLKSDRADIAISLLDKYSVDKKNESLTWLLKGQALTKINKIAEAARSMRMFIQLRDIEEMRA